MMKSSVSHVATLVPSIWNGMNSQSTQQGLVDEVKAVIGRDRQVLG